MEALKNERCTKMVRSNGPLKLSDFDGCRWFARPAVWWACFSSTGRVDLRSDDVGIGPHGSALERAACATAWPVERIR